MGFDDFEHFLLTPISICLKPCLHDGIQNDKTTLFKIQFLIFFYHDVEQSYESLKL